MKTASRSIFFDLLGHIRAASFLASLPGALLLSGCVVTGPAISKTDVGNLEINIRAPQSVDVQYARIYVAFSAKRHWRYPERWIEAWRDTLTVRADFINAHETYAAVVDGRTLGFYALCCAEDRLRLEHLWVLPEAMNRGVGRTLFTHAVERGKALGYRAMEIESDPNAEGFRPREPMTEKRLRGVHVNAT